MRSHSNLLTSFAIPAHRKSASGVTKKLRGPASFIGGGNPLHRPPLYVLPWNGGALLLLRPTIRIGVHHIHERALDQVGKFKGATERAVTPHAFIHVAGNLDTQDGACL